MNSILHPTVEIKLSRADIRRAEREKKKGQAKHNYTTDEFNKVVNMGVDKMLQKKFPEMQTRIFNTVMTSFFYVLSKDFGFGKDRLKKVRTSWDETLRTCLTPDPDGLPYLKFEDMAVYLNERYGLDINQDECIKADTSNTEALFRDRYKISIGAMYEWLMGHGHEQAAEEVRLWWPELFKED